MNYDGKVDVINMERTPESSTVASDFDRKSGRNEVKNEKEIHGLLRKKLFDR
jgi:hypothetical protein